MKDVSIELFFWIVEEEKQGQIPQVQNEKEHLPSAIMKCEKGGLPVSQQLEHIQL